MRALPRAAQPLQRLPHGRQFEERRGRVKYDRFTDFSRRELLHLDPLLGRPLPAARGGIEQRLGETEVEDGWQRAARCLGESVGVESAAAGEQVRSEPGAIDVGFARSRLLLRLGFDHANVVS